MVDSSWIGVAGIVGILAIMLVSGPSLTGEYKDNTSIYNTCMEMNNGKMNAKAFCMCRIAQDKSDCTRFLSGEWDTREFYGCVSDHTGENIGAQYNYCKKNLKAEWIQE